VTRQEVFADIRGAEDEYRAAVLALDRLQSEVTHDVTTLAAADVAPRDIVACARNLERTYVIRVYASFEAALRDYWQSPRGCRRSTEPPAGRLIQSIAARRRVDAATVQRANEVREYRNDLVHGGSPALRLTLQECRSFLCRFVSYLPVEW
jgi:hypothetical protein